MKKSTLPLLASAMLILTILFSLCVAASMRSNAADALGDVPGNDRQSDLAPDMSGRTDTAYPNVGADTDVDTDTDTDTDMDTDRGRDNTDNGKVLDGKNDDRAGIIGDEKDNGSVQGVTDENDGTFWGIVIALAIAAAVILLIALIIPKETGTSKR